MQHYGAPTRLLDFTESFWIALFFAFEEAENNCCVIALDRSSLASIPPEPDWDYNDLLRQSIESGGLSWANGLYADVPFFTNERLAIQKGMFVFPLNGGRTFQDLAVENQKTINTLIVDKCLFGAIRTWLNDFNCNSRVLFPGIDGYGRYFKNASLRQ